MNKRDHVADYLAAGQESEAAMQRVWSGVQNRTAKPARARRWPIAAAAAAAVALLCLGLWPQRSAPLVLASGAPLAPVEAVSAPVVLALSDGSQLDLLPGSSVSPTRSSGTEVNFALQSGRVRFDVQPGGPRAWTIRSTRFTVRVIGTAFTVEENATRASVEVERGRVSVTENGSGRTRLLAAGESWIISPSAAADSPDHEQAAIQDRQRTVPGAAEEALEASTRETLERTNAAPQANALDAPERSEPADESEIEESPLNAVDAARRAGDTTRAIALLEVFLEASPDHPEAPLGAITLGRIEKRRGNDRGAANAYGAARRYALPRTFADEACAERAFALARLGERDASRSSAGECLGRNPQTAYRSELRVLLRAR